jgi:hypothetical protein
MARVGRTLFAADLALRRAARESVPARIIFLSALIPPRGRPALTSIGPPVSIAA